ncbi:MAG: endolytic transglycosylase MltG [Acidobacteriota bacterium]|nr:endolytic transglycosylase MltG [Acidobacteriota bacterium]
MILRILKGFLTAALMGILGFSAWIVPGLYRPVAGPGDPPVLFEAGRGSSAALLGRELQDRGMIHDRRVFLAAYRLFFHPETLKAGDYGLSFPLTTKDVLIDFSQGRLLLQTLTIPEGLIIEETAEAVIAQGFLQASDFAEAAQNPDLISAVDPQAFDMEGYLFPDTYHLSRKATSRAILRMMTGQFLRVFNDDWRQRADEIGMSVRDVVILASLIEKETSLERERDVVASVFHNRLRIGMKLDCDPTIIFALKKEGRFTGRLRTRDMRDPTPYNTYVHRGLPPGPICSPGRNSLYAALYPAETEYFFFVSRNDGSHHFSRTYREHLAAVRKYQLKK